MDNSLLISKLLEIQNFSEPDLHKLVPYFEERIVKKNEFVFQAGDVVKDTFFVQKGILRQYFVTPENKERTVYFVQEGSFAGEVMSFLHQIPSEFYFQALEDSIIFSLNRKRWEFAYTTIPALALHQLKLHARFIFDLKQEIANTGKETPDERYKRLLKEYPALFQRIPLFHIATYLGITPETLSRIRKRNMNC
ncbi:cAMP-binding domain of CRP or a regulatory subunit of cAMP-dependent protein kinases [Dyadobacter koreensis]|uniref:cAMP-binding domain of CRP or a regulatory subunit of cAMP-dependent protein kinases n=1 Tax=Dyadobacter koreensis TaxID=408657 RepID=A0A1H6QJV8_9BACT|nr:Crp/Fnr family transcriptional regulator [Dyadobacter koreensis]SEI39272.1 cAMP-binding domain of CRP or a regulatory subunit of cAMP-dependent protein kinases [Dyadobacter koreensis]